MSPVSSVPFSMRHPPREMRGPRMRIGFASVEEESHGGGVVETVLEFFIGMGSFDFFPIEVKNSLLLSTPSKGFDPPLGDSTNHGR